MDTFSDWSQSSFGAPKPYDEAASEGFADTLHRIGSTPFRLEDVSSTYEKARQNQMLVDSATSRGVARAAWFDSLSDRVKAASGVDLVNPARLSEVDLLERAARSGQTIDDNWREQAVSAAEQDFFKRVDELKGQFPQLQDIGQNASQGPAAFAAAASQAFQQDWQRTDVNPLAKGIGAFSGSFMGGLKAGDPVAIASLAAPVGGKGVTVLERLASAILTQSAVGAGTAAIEQPFVQSWRKEIGVSSGLTDALENIALGGAFGAAGGALFQGGSEAVAAAFRKAGVHVSPEMENAMRGAAAADEADAAVREAVPATVPDHAAPAQVADGLRMVDDPAAPAPLVDHAVPSGVTDDVAREIMAREPDPISAAASLKASEEAFTARVAQEVRAAEPDLFARADRLDADLQSSRQRIAELTDLRQRMIDAPALTGEAEAMRLAGELAGAEQNLADLLTILTGKRRTSPRVKTARQAIDDIKARIEETRQTAAAVMGRSIADTDREIAVQRQRLMEAWQARADLGPKISAAHAAVTERLASEAPSGITSALSSADPLVRDTGRLATLDASALDQVRSGEALPMHAAIVAATVHDPALQGKALAAVRAAGARTAEDVRIAASDAVAAEHAVGSHVAMVAGQPFGPVIHATPETFLDAIAEARALGAGEIVGALHHPELGLISIPLGNARQGILHIERHPEVHLGELPEIIARSAIVGRTKGRVTLFDGVTEVGVRLTWRDEVTGAETARQWVLTAFQPDDRQRMDVRRNGRPGTEASQAPVSQAGADLPPSPTFQNVHSVMPDIKDTVPIPRTDGTIELMTRDQLVQRAAERERLAVDIVQACKI